MHKSIKKKHDVKYGVEKQWLSLYTALDSKNYKILNNVSIIQQQSFNSKHIFVLINWSKYQTLYIVFINLKIQNSIMTSLLY